ncbi:MAG TPA: branched-chain amino acid ABC transporter permease [Casimicrobiaceae bacterium]|nr:branched-chain amino acid ABC transporter permease [Casimicrobiaceae bacterium]
MPTRRSELTHRDAGEPAGRSRGRQLGKTLGITLLIIGALLLIAGPALLNPYWMRVFSNIFMYAVLAQGINIMAGYTGYPAFGNVVFFGLGGYVAGVLMAKFGAPFAIAMPVATALCPLLVIAIGPPLLRLKGHYFAIATLGLNESVKELVANATLTGGGMGLSVPLPPWGPVASGAIFYYLFLAVMLVGVWATWEFSRRRLGIGCGAIRDNEEKAGAIGLHTTRYKTAAWMISAALTGAVGALNAYQLTYIDPPSAFDMAISVKSFVIFLLGGAGTVLGPVAGAFIVELLATYTWSKLLNWHTGALGALIIAVVMLAPNGLRDALRRVPSLSALREWIDRRRVRTEGTTS